MASFEVTTEGNIAAAYTKHQLLHEDEFAMNRRFSGSSSDSGSIEFSFWYDLMETGDTRKAAWTSNVYQT